MITRTSHRMASWLTRQRIPATQIRVIDLRRELQLLLGWSLAYVILSGCTAQLIRHLPFPILGSPDFLLDYWYVLFFKISCLLLIPFFVYWKLGYRLRDIAPQGLTARDYAWSLVAFAAGAAINSGYWPGVIQQVQENTSADVVARIGIAILIALFNAAIPEEFFFRYWLQTRLEHRFGRIAAITGAALLFTAWHIPSRYFLASGGEGHAGSLGSVLMNTGLPVLLVGLIVGVLWGPPSSPFAVNRLALGNRQLTADRRYSRAASLEQSNSCVFMWRSRARTDRGRYRPPLVLSSLEVP
jgi:membrane protease YdiL (CAAX protease family)